MSKNPKGGFDIFEDVSHYEVDDGRAFRMSFFQAELTATTTKYISVVTGSERNMHINWQVAVGGSSVVRFFEDATAGSLGTALAITCLNRQITCVVHSLLIYNIVDPATIGGGDTGTSIGIELIPGGVGVGNTVFGGVGSGQFDMILDTSSTYLLSIENTTADTITANVILDILYDLD